MLHFHIKEAFYWLITFIEEDLIFFFLHRIIRDILDTVWSLEQKNKIEQNNQMLLLFYSESPVNPCKADVT